ncbi:hypothetical protein QL285_070923 [Trifolium repens]|nr:hypothetical protein QL285_070923 [Trifolium repens]
MNLRILGRELSRTCAIDGGEVGVEVITAIVVVDEKLVLLWFWGFHEKWGFSRESVDLICCGDMSYTWSSIQRASWILKKGGLWTVGNGASINIWEDNWLPEQEGYKVWSQKKEGVTQNMVQDLIIPLSKSWNRGIITKLFYPVEAQQVLNIPITDINYQDELCWPKTTDGTYTVKSGYHAIKEWDSKTGDPSTSGSNNDNPCWGKIWMQNILPKHNQLVWRILNNVLPVRDNTTRK